MSDIFYKGEFQRILLRDYGVDIADDSVTLDSRQLYRIIEAVGQVSISVLDLETGTTKTLTLPDGFTLFGRFKEVSVTSVAGEIKAYLGEDRPLKYNITPQGTIQYIGTEGVGDSFVIDGKEFIVVDNSTLFDYAYLENPEVEVCTTLVTNLNSAWYFASPPKLDLSTWDTSNVTNMTNTFRDIGEFNQDLSKWDTSSVTSMSYMFAGTTFNRDISGWDVSSVTNMESMFENTPFNQPIGKWNVSLVTNMFAMLGASDFNQPLDEWDVSSVQNFNSFIYNTPFNQNINSWDTSAATNMNFMFFGCSDFNRKLDQWDTSLVTSMEGMFNGASNFKKDISTWCVELIPTVPNNFALDASTDFTEAKQPNWGVACA